MSDNKFEVGNGPWANAWKIAAGVGVLGMLGAGAGFASDAKRFAFSYLFAITVILTLSLGTLFFVVVQHIAASGWSVPVRRVAEFFVGAIPVMVVLFLPLFAVMQHFPQWEHYGHATPAAAEHGTTEQTHGEHGQAHSGHNPTAEHGQAEHTGPAADPAAAGLHHMHHQALDRKKKYFDTGFFYLRQALYLLSWVLLSRRFFKGSTDQDKSKDKKITVMLARSAPLSIAIFSMTMTFCAFDWLMALDPAWYSTIFGVWIFAGACVSSLAAIILLALALRRSGLIDKAVSVEHMHDMTKLMFGFNCFWAYITFCQFFLIWYASIPEETVFYHARWNDNTSWQPVGLLLIFGHFVTPFILLMSRNMKRRMPVVAFGAVLLLLMHVTEIYWLVLPMYKSAAHGVVLASGEAHGLPINWMDFACLIGVVGVYMAAVLRLLSKHPLIPVGDPRLPRGLHHDVG